MLTKLDADPEWTTTNAGVEETTQKAVVALFKLKAEGRRDQDKERYKKRKAKN